MPRVVSCMACLAREPSQTLSTDYAVGEQVRWELGSDVTHLGVIVSLGQ